MALCKYFPDRDAWLATHLGQPPLSFIDAATGSDREPSFMFNFSDGPDELSVRSSGEVTFEADDRGETATLTWVSETNQGGYFDSQGVRTGDVEMGSAELTVECGSIFRYE
ncbi:MAG TPA: hypothetical protein VMP67_04140 [Candidatus Limnocylindria bacterium]|nr:hypothetical protein [Candidatus Limnocylindria bacterium]